MDVVIDKNTYERRKEMISIPIKLKLDEKGYLDRECPNEQCLYKFKINMEDWENNVSDKEVHCPMCGHIDTSDKWWTQEQLEEMRNIAQNYAMSYLDKELNKSFKKLEKCSNKFIKIKYNPGKKITFINNPIGQSKEWNLDIKCKECGTRYSVIGSAYFCPCCGYNSAEDVFEESLDTIEKMLDSTLEMKKMFSESYGDDKAETMVRSMIEGTLGDVVSAYQKFAEMKYRSLSENEVRVNDFQIVEKGSELFKKITSYGYDKWLNDSELKKMNLYFQRRHVIEHNNGIVDQKYIDKSEDSSYSIGQRIIVKIDDAYDLSRIIKKLANGLNEV